MDITNQIRSNFPKTIDKSKPVFSSIIANDNGDASIQRQLLDLITYMREWLSTPDIYQQSGVMLEKTVKFFSFLERYADESENSLKNRFKAIFVRNHDTRWGTVYDVKNVFRQYFPHAVIYVVENTNKIDDPSPSLANLIVDGDIETDTPIAWTLNNCSASAEARFSKAYGILLNQSGAAASQSININASTTYFLHFFLKGKVNVQIKDNNNKYWNFATKSWNSSAVNNSFSSVDTWNNESLFFITANNATSITITFSYVDTKTYIDYFRLFAKQPYGSFTVIAHFEGDTAESAFGLAAGDADPNIETQESTPPLPRYNNYGYFDKSFLSGVAVGFAKDVYEDLLDYLRAQGVKAYLDIVIKDA